MPEQLQPLLGELGVVLEGKKCKGCGGMASDPRTGYVCPTCHGTGEDPAYDGLREVVTKPKYSSRHRQYLPVTRNWSGMPKGALKGAIEWALISTAVPGIVWENFLAYHSESPEVPDDDDLAAVKAVLEALR